MSIWYLILKLLFCLRKEEMTLLWLNKTLSLKMVLIEAQAFVNYRMTRILMAKSSEIFHLIYRYRILGESCSNIHFYSGTF